MTAYEMHSSPMRMWNTNCDLDIGTRLTIHRLYSLSLSRTSSIENSIKWIQSLTAFTTSNYSMFKCTFVHTHTTPFCFLSPIFYITIYFTFRCALLFVCCQLFSLRALINVFTVKFIVFIFLFRTNNHKISHIIPLHRLLLLFPFYQCAVEKGSPLL